MTDLETELANIEKWRKEHAAESSTLEYLKKTLTHKLLIQIIDGKADPAEVYLRLKQIEDGTHPLLSDTRSAEKD